MTKISTTSAQSFAVDASIAIERPSTEIYYAALAMMVSARAECIGLKVGAVLVRGDRVAATGYNGTPSGFPNCSDGGCVRCSRRTEFGPGVGYDKCICVHAEANALLSAARFGVAVDGAIAYVTHQPCFSCAKELIQAGVSGLFYINEWKISESDPGLQADLVLQHKQLMQHLAASPVERSAVTACISQMLCRHDR
jgi:dCMP deaminase